MTVVAVYRRFYLLFLLICLSSLTLNVNADGRSPMPSPDAKTQAALASLTTTNASIPLAPPEPPLPQQSARTNTSGALIGLDDFRHDPRFAGIDGAGFAVVVIDTGIDLDHPFFGDDNNGDEIADRIVYQYDFADNDADATDVHGHGSNVTSIALSSDVTYTGMAPGADIIHLKVFRDSGSGNFGDVEEALQWVVANAVAYNIVSVNMSLSDPTSNYQAPTAGYYGIGDELAALTGLGVTVVSSSGNRFYTFNGETGVSYPSADPNSFSVGAVFDTDIGAAAYGSGAMAYSSAADRLTPFSQRHQTMSTIFAPG
ncbi:MAG: S8 family serine peptidase, partial [Anaerolineae bacterium]|nr:S8 family serine peptidase [Anaerolineae bacterium]